MTPRRYRAEQFAYAFLLTACGLAVAVGILGRALDEMVTMPRPR